jgi:hypothetical protein
MLLFSQLGRVSMGRIYSAVCKCGYVGNAKLGAGRQNYTEVCAFPHYCKTCKEVVGLDICKEPHFCPKCSSNDVQSYEALTQRTDSDELDDLSDTELEKLGLHRGAEAVGSWDGELKEHALLKGPHHCPKCEQPALHFKPGAFFD